MEIKTAEEIYEDNGCNSKRDIIEAMKKYAEQFIQLCTDKADVKVTFDTIEGGIVDAEVDRQSILKIKELIK